LEFRFFAAFISEWLGTFGTAWLLSNSPRFKKPPLGFLYPRRDGFIALSLSAVIILFSFVYYEFYPAVLPEPQRIAQAPVHDLTQALTVAAICLVPFIISLVLRRQPIRSLGWNPAFFTPGLQVGFALAVLTLFLHNRFLDVLSGRGSEQMFPLLLALGISLVEETIFRGYVQQRLAWWLGPVRGILLTAAISTLWHLPVWLNRLELATILLLVMLTFIQGLVLGWVMRKTGHVIAPALYRTISIWMQFIG
jgi:membrane protease YdiL (CAAX protease family)